jgi:hypothetical protein
MQESKLPSCGRERIVRRKDPNWESGYLSSDLKWAASDLFVAVCIAAVVAQNLSSDRVLTTALSGARSKMAASESETMKTDVPNTLKVRISSSGLCGNQMGTMATCRPVLMTCTTMEAGGQPTDHDL